MAVLRKKPTSVIRTSASKPDLPRNWFMLIKPLLVLLCVIVGYVVFSNWSAILEKLDTQPIRSFYQTHKTEFTTYDDLKNKLSETVKIPITEASQPVLADANEPKKEQEFREEPLLKGYFSQNMQQIKDRLLELDWVSAVYVHKIYPDKLRITLIEHKPVAVWNDEKFLSDQGVVFSLPKDRFDAKNLPILYGSNDKSKVVLEAWGKIKQDLSARQLGLRAVAMDNRGSWTISLDNGVELRLGRGEWLPKIDRFVGLFPDIQVPEGKRLAYVDLRYEHGASVGFSNK